MVRSRAGMEAAVVLQAVGAFNLSLVRGCAHYCKLNSLGSPRRVTTMRATVICPRGMYIYIYIYIYIYVCVYATASGEKRLENQMPVVLNIGFIAVARTTRCDRE